MPLSLRLAPELEARIAAYCEQTGLSKSKVISLGIKDYLDSHAAPTLYDLARDLLPDPVVPATNNSENRRKYYRKYVKEKHARRASTR